MPAKLRVGEILSMYRSFYRKPADVAGLVEVLGLSGKQDAYYRSLSGGQRQRLSVALALIGQPEIAVLDEMTTGLDPQARRDTWELIEGVRDRALMPHVLQDISNLTPLGAAVQAIQDSMQTGFRPAAPLLVLTAYTLVAAFLARRFFRWE